MKKPINLSLKERNNLINRNRLGKNRKKEKKRDFKKNRAIAQNPYSRKSRRALSEIDLPEKFDLHENTDATLKTMGRFRAILDKADPRLKKLNFDAIQYINPLSSLMLAAEIDVWKIKSSQSLSANHATWNNEVKCLLCEMGFFELLNMPPLDNLPQVDKNTVFLKFISGVGSDGKKAKQLRENIEKALGKTLENKLHLFDGLSEAFTNTTQHAYDEKTPTNKWWITAAYKKDNNKLIVSMYDRGKSIPTTMHTNKRWLFLNERTTTSHNKLLETAMESSFYNKNNRTQTQEKNRGKGLKQLLDFVKVQGKLTIISNKGYCAFEVNDDNLSIVKQKELKYPLQGTLIEWDIDLPRT